MLSDEHRVGKLTIWEFGKAAFKGQNNLILFIGGLLAAILSFQPLVVFPLVLAVEILYLILRASSPRFQAVVRARLRQSQKESSSAVAERIFAGLNDRRKQRFDGVRSRCLALQESLKRAGSSPSEIGSILEDQQIQSVNQLLWVFLRTLAYEEALESFSRGMPRADIEKTVKQTEAALESGDLTEGMRQAYVENLDVLKKRLENLDRAEDNLKSIAARLIRVENSIMLIQEQALTRQDPAFIEAEVNSATAGLSSMEQVLGSIDLPAFDPGTSGPTPELLALGFGAGGEKLKT
jgi:hypothetical protein